MKVLIISPSPPEYLGGLALFVKNLVLHLEDKNIEVDLLTSTLSKKGPLNQKIGENIDVRKQKVYLFPDNDNILRIKNPLFFIMKYLKKKAHKYDLIHVHSYIYFCTFQTYIYKYLFNRKIPIVLHLHGGIQTEEYETSTVIEKILLFFKKYFFDIIVGKSIIEKSDALISVSKEDLLEINRVFKINRHNHNYFIPNVINSKDFKKIDKFQRKYIGFIGRLTKIKGIDLFLDLIQKISEQDKNQEFLIIGEGPYLKDVQDALEKYPITFIKNMGHEEMVEYYNQCLVYVQTSRAEGLSTCVLEALASEVPVVASNVGGTNEVVLNGQTGYLFESGNTDQAVKYINKIKVNNEATKLGNQGRALIKSKYSWQAITEKIIRIYENVLKDNRNKN